ncbi:hypothetical protein BDZ90DRAFT_164012 [Jaminaea rosea]|uniref:Secreted protein n=1 Tax=Jaminaea rosea TaxID=1569628 RepID=A0A316UTM6_9BASI|nr:hypothetical protein BDZ90DRAFT_164012 [Jaminaea rosea]PWN28158.1 hypothetical protein BDZ90DRAFT_164012 [Jaminaea rosea]
MTLRICLPTALSAWVVIASTPTTLRGQCWTASSRGDAKQNSATHALLERASIQKCRGDKHQAASQLGSAACRQACFRESTGADEASTSPCPLVRQSRARSMASKCSHACSGQAQHARTACVFEGAKHEDKREQALRSWSEMLQSG